MFHVYVWKENSGLRIIDDDLCKKSDHDGTNYDSNDCGDSNDCDSIDYDSND